jgi:phenylacetic acid degradation operon negative regulatory protein
VVSVLLPLARPELPVRSLVRCCELFGIPAGTTRVALSRMVAAGELESTDASYRLTGPMLARQERQRAARQPRLRSWSGAWLVAVVAVERRAPADRAALRAVLARRRLGELRPAVWLRPDNLAETAETTGDDTAGLLGQCLWLRGSLVDGPPSAAGVPSDATALAGRLWDLAGWARDARRLLGELERTLPRLTAGDLTALAPCFMVAAAAVRHITHDPLLPPELLPSGWPGDALRNAYDAYEAAYRRLLRTWLTTEGDGEGDPAPGPSGHR